MALPEEDKKNQNQVIRDADGNVISEEQLKDNTPVLTSNDGKTFTVENKGKDKQSGSTGSNDAGKGNPSQWTKKDANDDLAKKTGMDMGAYDIGFYEDFANQDNINREEYRVRTPEEIERQRKIDRRNAIFSAIGDGVSALSNLYFTTKGAPSTDPGQSRGLSDAVRKASDSWWKDERLRRKNYNDAKLKEMDIKRKMKDAENRLLQKKNELMVKLNGQQMSKERIDAQNRRFAAMCENENRRWYAERLIDIANKLSLLDAQSYQAWNTYINARKNGIKMSPPGNLGFDVEGLMKQLDDVMILTPSYGIGYNYGMGYGQQPQQPAQQPQPSQEQGASQQPQRYSNTSGVLDSW